MEDVHGACRSFAKSVNDYIDRIILRRRRRRRKRLRDDDDDDDDNDDDDDDDDESSSLRDECNELVKHANLVLCTLVAKRSSLANAISALRAETEDYVERFAAAAAASGSASSSSSLLVDDDVEKNKNVVVDDEIVVVALDRAQVEIVRRWFANYVRLRDGFVLLESGERRHDHDDDDDDVSFPSMLGGAYRSDGYTRKFKSERGYTGRGYDEAYDPDVGIKRRLLMALSRFDDDDCRTTTGEIDERLFENESTGAYMWEKRMDEVNDTSELRNELVSVVEYFRNGINAVSKVKLKTRMDDKFDRFDLGDTLVLSRSGNDYKVKDRGGSLPIGMSVDDWRGKFSLSEKKKMKKKKRMDIARATKKGGLLRKKKAEEDGTVKKRKVILEDSSEEEDDDDHDDVVASHPTSNVDADDRDVEGNDHDDGLMVQVRVATDVSSGSNSHRGSVDGGDRTTSIDEIKRQLGVDAVELQRGHEQLEDEQLLSTMAANEEDMLEGVLLRDGHEDERGKNDGGKSYYSILAPLLKRCFSHRNEIRKNMHNLELLREMQDVCSDFDDSAKRWDDRLQCLIEIRNEEIANGLLDETSDRAYNVRENFREANMLLGIDSIEVYEFFSRIQKERPTEQRRFASNPSSFTDDSLSKACHSFLMFAQETFRTALNLVLEHERCQATSSPVATIDNLWEKGQHLLLRGRAHYNIGLTMYELARSSAATERRQVQQRGGGQVESNTPLLMKARDEFDKAVERAKSVRHNTLLIRRHPNTMDTSSQSIYSWTTDAIMQLLEAMKLEMLASESYIASSWKLGKTEAVKERFDGVFESVEVSDVMNFANTKGVSLLEIAEVVCDMYWLAMRVAVLSTEHLESLSVGKDWDVSAGEAFFQIALKALNRVRMISTQVLKFDESHSLHYVKERDISKANIILQEENEIRKWWESTKTQARKRLSDVSRSGCEATVFPRGDVSVELGVTSSSEVVDPRITRRIIVQSDDRLFQNRSKSQRTTRVKKKDCSGDGDIGERFSSEFCPSNEGAANEMGASCSSMGRAMHTPTVFRKWGNEVLEEHERKRCCPALPDNFADMGISIDVIRALEKKLGLVLPAKN